ncbi:MAG: hypothetical protein AAFQ54_06210 [Pseudomonadota bacterium]
MSDPVTNVDIEDVLSSIRRLVSQDNAPRQETPPAPDALILTESQRVAEPKGDAAGAVEPEEEETPEAEPDEPTETVLLDDQEADAHDDAVQVEPVEDMVDDLPPEDVPGMDAGQDALVFRTSHVVRTELERAIEELEASMSAAPEDGDGAMDDTLAGLQDIDWDARVVGRAADAELEESVAAEDEPEVADAPDETHAAWENEESEQADAEPAPPAAPRSSLEGLRLVTRASDASAEDFDGDYDTGLDTLSPSFAPQGDEEVSGDDEQGDVHEAVAGVPWEDVSDEDGTDADEPASAPMDFEHAEDEDEAEAFRAPEPPFDSDQDDHFTDFEGVDAPASQVAQIDEEQLREMVTEIVRTELQGELGERITRNVRKLVRREINRALAGQDLI